MNGDRTAAGRSSNGPRTEISPAEFAAALENVRAGNLRIASVGELLRAFELGVLTRTEVRSRRGLGAPQGSGAATQARTGGKFVRVVEDSA